MTTICGFKRNNQVVLAWDTLITEDGKRVDVICDKGKTFFVKTSHWSMACAGDSSLGRRAIELTRQHLEEKSIHDLPDVLIQKLGPLVSWKENIGYSKTMTMSAALTDGRRLYEIGYELFVYEVNSVFIGSGADLARGAYEALKNTKISNKALLELVYGIVSSIDCYTGPEFISNL